MLIVDIRYIFYRQRYNLWNIVNVKPNFNFNYTSPIYLVPNRIPILNCNVNCNSNLSCNLNLVFFYQESKDDIPISSDDRLMYFHHWKNLI